MPLAVAARSEDQGDGRPKVETREESDGGLPRVGLSDASPLRIEAFYQIVTAIPEPANKAVDSVSPARGDDAMPRFASSKEPGKPAMTRRKEAQQQEEAMELEAPPRAKAQDQNGSLRQQGTSDGRHKSYAGD